MGARNCIDLAELPRGATYEDRYGSWLQLFRSIAYTPLDVLVVVAHAPPSWVALLAYMRCRVISTKVHFREDRIPQLLVGKVVENDREQWTLRRSDIEALCVWRPETVDGLYKFDNEWRDAARRPWPSTEKEFPVTTTASFFRPEVLRYLNDVLPAYTPSKRKVVLCPCAADKPYPAPLHEAILAVLPQQTWYLATVTGTLGIVPQDLWPAMPYYDAGIPNELRVEEEVRKYFIQHEHEKIVVYSDFNARAIARALRDVTPRVSFLFGTECMTYQDLLSDESIARLESAVREGGGK